MPLSGKFLPPLNPLSFLLRTAEGSFSAVQDAVHIFDWCAWEWEINGGYGVWDADFRYETYSLKINSWAVRTVSLTVSFNESVAAAAEETANVTRRAFRHCLSLPQKIEEIARAIKQEMDSVYRLLKSWKRKVVRRARPSGQCDLPRSGDLHSRACFYWWLLL